jgi:hypothetical protein
MFQRFVIGPAYCTHATQQYPVADRYFTCIRCAWVQVGIDAGLVHILLLQRVYSMVRCRLLADRLSEAIYRLSEEALMVAVLHFRLR